jgi:hypothetical protein
MDSREQLVAYLLGELGEEERSRLEQEYLARDADFEQVLVTEDELAYEYLQGRLSPQRRQRFETTIAATERGQRNLQFAQLLLDALRESKRVTAWPRAYRYGAIAALLLLAVLPAWLTVRVAGLTAELQKSRNDSAASIARLNRELANERKTQATPLEMAFLLTPGLTRGNGAETRLQVSAAADTLRLELVAPPGSTTGDYVVTISHGGAQVWSGSAQLSGRMLIAKAPAKLFSGGAYETSIRRLTAGEQAPELATYNFQIIRN